MRFSLPALLFLALPALEIATFIVVGRRIGVAATLGLVVLTSLVGVMLLRSQGLGLLARLRQDVASGEGAERSLVHGAMMAAGGLLLLLPGFLTDILGLLLFIPALRDLAWSLASRHLVVVRTARHGRPGPQGAATTTIDLDAGDYSSEPRPGGRNPDSPWAEGRKPTLPDQR